MAGELDGLRTLLPAATLPLGTFVVFPGEPLKASFTPKTNPPTATIVAENATDIDKKSSETEGTLSLTEIFSARCQLKSDALVDLQAATSTLQQIVQYDDWYQGVCKTDEARIWFERQLERYGAKDLRLFFIIGRQTVQNATLILNGSQTVRAQVAARVPVTGILGDPAVLSKLVDPSAKANLELINASGQKFSVAETIYAVKYGVVKFKYRSSRWLAKMLGLPPELLDKSSLETNTRWVVMGTDAGGDLDSEATEAQLEEEDFEDMIEAILCKEDPE